MMMLVKRCVEDQGKKLVEPPEVLAVTEKYRAEQDMLSAFIAEHLQRNESGRSAVRGAVRCVQGSRVPYHGRREAAPEQIGSMVTKFKATALSEPGGEPDTPVHRQCVLLVVHPERRGFTPQDESTDLITQIC
jgi:hypothetical protein